MIIINQLNTVLSDWCKKKGFRVEYQHKIKSTYKEQESVHREKHNCIFMMQKSIHDSSGFLHLLSTYINIPGNNISNVFPSNRLNYTNYLHLCPSDRISFSDHASTSENWPSIPSLQRNGHHEIDIFLVRTIQRFRQVYY